MKKCKTSRTVMFDKPIRAVIARQAACLLASLALCCGAAEYTWTGNGAAGNWNDAANWSPSTGAPNAGDTAKLTLSADLTITSDIALSAGTLVISNNGAAVSFTGVISGAGGLELRGDKGIELKGANTFGGGVFRNSFLSYVDLYHENGLGTGKFTACEGSASGSGKNGSTPLRIHGSSMTVPNDMEFGHESYVSWNGAIYFKNSATFTGTMLFKTQTRFGEISGGSFKYIRFKNTITATGCLVVQNIGGKEIYYEKAPVGGRFFTDSGHSPKVHFLEGGGSIEFLTFSGTSYPTYYMDADDVLNSSVYATFNSYRGKIDLNGHSQTIGYIYDNGVKSQTGRCVTNSSATAATFTMKPKANYMFGGTFDGNMSLVYSADTTARVYTLSNSFSTMSGTLNVEKGTFQIKSGTTLDNLSGLTIGAGAQFKVLDGTSSVNENIPISIGSTASRFALPAGMRLFVSSLTLGGEPLPYGTYVKKTSTLENATPVDWLDGDGVLVYPAPVTTITWTGAGADTLVTNPDNWAGLSAAPDLTQGSINAVFPPDAQSFTATFPAGISRFAGLTVNATNFTFAAAEEGAILGIGSDGITYGHIAAATRDVVFNVPVAPLDEQSWSADLASTEALLRIAFNRPFVDDPFGRGAVTITGGGKYTLYSTNSTYTGDMKIDKELAGGAVYAYGYEPFGPAGTLRVVGKDNNNFRLQLTGVTTAKTIILDCASSPTRRRTLAYSGVTTFKGLVYCNIEGTRDANGTVDNNTVSGTVIYEGGYGNDVYSTGSYSGIYVNWGANGTVVVTGMPFRVGTIQGSFNPIHIFTPSNTYRQINGWHQDYSPYGMTANIHFHTNFAFYTPSFCSILGTSVWDFHGTEQTIGSFNSYGSGSSGSMISTNGPGRLNIRQARGWDSLAKSASGFLDFSCACSFKGEMSLNMTGTRRLIVTSQSTATGCVDVAESAILCFTNSANWATATNVAVRANGKIEAWNGNVLGRNTDLTLADSGIYEFCGAGPYVQKVRYLWLNGQQRKTGTFTPANSGGRIVGNGKILVLGDGKGLTLIFR